MDIILEMLIIGNFEKVSVITKCVVLAWKLVHTRFIVLLEPVYPRFTNIEFFLELSLIDVCYYFLTAEFRVSREVQISFLSSSTRCVSETVRDFRPLISPFYR